LHYGELPWHPHCLGEASVSVDLRVLEFWQNSLDGWNRVPEHEISLVVA
jgi:hypothetical protein